MAAPKKTPDAEVQVELLDAEPVKVEPVVSELVITEAKTTDINKAEVTPPVVEEKPITNNVVTENLKKSEAQKPESWVSEMEETETDTTVDRQTSKWIVVIVVLVLLVLALAGGVVYYLSQFGMNSNKGVISPAPDTPAVQPTPTPEVDSQSLELQKLNTSDSLESIKSDVGNTKLDTLDSGLEEIENQL